MPASPEGEVFLASEQQPVVQPNPFTRNKNNKQTADAKARALFQSCQEAANRTVIESMGNVDHTNTNTEKS